MKAKDYAISLGLARPGRGRMSREAHEAIQKAIAGGMSFEDYKGAPAPKGQKVHVVKEQTEKPSKDKALDDYAPGFYRYPADQKFVGINPETQKRTVVNARQGCYHSRYSIMGCDHTGDTHRVLVGSGVWMDVTPVGE